MSLLAKTNYVKPHNKTSYIKPLCGISQTAVQGKTGSILHMDKENGFGSPIKSAKAVNEKEKTVESLNSAYYILFEEIEKIQAWKTSMLLEYKQKNKKLEEMSKIIESQRKVVLDLQMQNEKLSIQMNDEVQQRVILLEKFSCTKELCSALEKKCQDLQLVFDNRNEIEDAFNARNNEKLEVLEDLTNKFNNIKIEYSEKINSLRNSLSVEQENTSRLKEICEQQNLNAEREHKSYCISIANYQKELDSASQQINYEKQKAASLEQEKTNLEMKISEIEKTNEAYLNKLKEIEEELRLSEDNKNEIENNYNSECIKVSDLNVKCSELEELISNQKSEFEEKCTTLETTVTTLKKCVVELEQKLEEYKNKNENLSLLVQEMEGERRNLENKISCFEREKMELKDEIKINAENAMQTASQLMKEKNELNLALQDVKEELQKTKLDKENAAKIGSEYERRLLEKSEEYETLVLKVQELGVVEKKYFEAQNTIAKLEDDIQKKSELLISKELQVEEIHSLNEKYANSLVQIKEFEDELQEKSRILQTKELELKELNKMEELYTTLLTNFQELEVEIKTKSELLNVKDKTISDLKAYMAEKDLLLEKMEYENMEMKDNIKKEKESVKICLECEIMKDMVGEYDQLMNNKKAVEEELLKQKQITTDTMKMLNETEDNFDEMRIKKEKEIIKHKERNETLQHEVNMLKVQVENLKKFEVEAESLQMKIKDMTLQNEGHLQRLKIENNNLNEELEKFKAVKNDSKDKITLTILEPEDRKPRKEEKVTMLKSPFRYDTTIDEKMEADSSCEEVTIINKGIKEIKAKKISKLTTRKPPRIQKSQVPEKRKRNWESGSSGSECLEIVFDGDTNVVMGLAPKGKPQTELRKVPLTPVGNRMNYEQLKLKNVSSDNNKQTPNLSENMKYSTMYKAAKTPENNSDFLNSREIFKQPNTAASPWMKRKELDVTPSTPVQRKFFKTPLKEREMLFKKPQAYKPWL